MISSICLIALAIQLPTDNWSKFNVAWRPESDAPFVKIRKEVEPYALSKSTTYSWMKSKADAASAAWKEDPKSAPALYRALLWERVIRTAHFNDVTPKDAERKEVLTKALRNWEKVPTSYEFSRIATSSLMDPELGSLARRVMARTPADGLFLCWAFDNIRTNQLSDDERDRLQELASSMFKRFPEVWFVRRAWAFAPWCYTDDTRIKDMPATLRKVEARLLETQRKATLGKLERQIVNEWLERLARHIPGYEDVVRKGRGLEKAYNWQG